MKRLLILAALLAAAPDTSAAWGPSGCRVVTRPAPVVLAAPSYQWHEDAASPGYWYLYQGQVQVGAYRENDGVFSWLNGDIWTRGESPIALPKSSRDSVSADTIPTAVHCSCKPKCECSPTCLCAGIESLMPKDNTPNFGMDWKPGIIERASCKGKDCTPREALELLRGDPAIPDDAALFSVTVIGTEADRRRVLADLDKHKASVKVQAYDASHWAAQPFKATASPTISFQAPDGKELSRMNDYTNGPARIDATLQKLRTPDPNYDPTKTPDLSKPKPEPVKPSAPSGPIKFNPNWLLAGALVFLIILKSKGAI